MVKRLDFLGTFKQYPCKLPYRRPVVLLKAENILGGLLIIRKGYAGGPVVRRHVIAHVYGGVNQTILACYAVYGKGIGLKICRLCIIVLYTPVQACLVQRPLELHYIFRRECVIGFGRERIFNNDVILDCVGTEFVCQCIHSVPVRVSVTNLSFSAAQYIGIFLRRKLKQISVIYHDEVIRKHIICQFRALKNTNYAVGFRAHKLFFGFCAAGGAQ